MGNRVYRPYTHPLIQNNVKKPSTTSQNGQSSFVSELQSALVPKNDQLIISKHAKQRLEQRGIQIEENKWQQISEKVIEAKKLGVKESLVLLDEAALIVSVKNQTVITAMDRKEAMSQIFTNINGTIVMD
jgi:flagellar operon protein